MDCSKNLHWDLGNTALSNVNYRRHLGRESLLKLLGKKVSVTAKASLMVYTDRQHCVSLVVLSTVNQQQQAARARLKKIGVP